MRAVPSTARPKLLLSHWSFCELRRSIVVPLFLAVATAIPSSTGAFVFATASRSHKNPFGRLLYHQRSAGATRTIQSAFQRPRTGSKVVSNNNGKMAFFASSSSENDSQTAFSRATLRLESPSAERNKGPIWEALSTKVIPNLKAKPITILETAAGAGVHTEHFSAKLAESSASSFVWHATDPEEDSLLSIAARVVDRNLGEVVAAPKKLTLGASGVTPESSSSDALPQGPLDLLISINMIHISPWEATLGLMKVAGEELREPSDSDDGGYLYCYGPYKQEGIIVPSNENFDMSLKSRNPAWGVRNLADVVKAAEKEGLELVEKIDMPANNTSLIFRRIRKPK